MNITTLFGKLREHELELGRLKEEEDGEKRHTITLKSAVKSVAKLKKAESADDSNDDYNSDSEALRLMVKGFSKFLKYKKKLTIILQKLKDPLGSKKNMFQPAMSVEKWDTSNLNALSSS